MGWSPSDKLLTLFVLLTLLAYCIAASVFIEHRAILKAHRLDRA